MKCLTFLKFCLLLSLTFITFLSLEVFFPHQHYSSSRETDASFLNGEELLKTAQETNLESDVVDELFISDNELLKRTHVRVLDDPPPDSLEMKLYPDLKDCPTANLKYKHSISEKYWVLENYVQATRRFRCDESITYTTHADHTLLDNLDPIVRRWQGPVSVALFAPGDDFTAAINAILYVRNCMNEKIKEFVSFHIILQLDHFPIDKLPTPEELLERQISCSKKFPFNESEETYRKNKGLYYPINKARNVAKNLAVTYFTFPSDIELYPSINVIPEFFKMLKRTENKGISNRRVYVFPIFEVEKNVSPPETKAELQKLLQSGKAITFHKDICAVCHTQPLSKKWIKAEPTDGLSVFNVAKRENKYRFWEPFYIGTAQEPFFDERLTWESKRNKIIHMFILCLKRYEFHILDNAFLIHRPGIKKVSGNRERNKLELQLIEDIKNTIEPQYKQLFGNNSKCKA